ncbi:putative reverse transcriptase domain-containing protein [Tanacetum coccineum]
MISSLNNDEIDFRISFDESDDEDCTVIFNKNSFSYKIISVNDLKTDSENDNEKVNIPSFPSREPTVSCFDDLDYFKDFDKEFPAIVYNDAVTSISDLLTELILNPQHINEFNLKDETSLSECDEEEQNVLNFNDLFPFNVNYPNDSKSDKDNDDDKVDIKHSSRDMSIILLSNISTLSERQAENKRKLNNTSKNNQNQQQPNKRQNTDKAYATGHREKKYYDGSKPLCPKCNYHHDGPCPPKCNRCNIVGHMVRNCRRPTNDNTANNQRGTRTSQKVNCYECGNQGHYKRDCPERKNQSHKNQIGGTGAHGVVHTLRERETDQDPNNIKDEIKA